MEHSLTKLDLSNCGLAKTLMAACIDGLKDAASVDQLVRARTYFFYHRWLCMYMARVGFRVLSLPSSSPSYW